MNIRGTSTPPAPAPTDLRLLPPASCISRPVNALLKWLGLQILAQPWAALFIYFLLYAGGILLVHLPWLNLPRTYIPLAYMAFMLVPLVIALGYLLGLLVLQALFARNPATRLGAAVLLWVLILGPALIMALSDTHLMLQSGDTLTFILLVGNLILTPVLAFRYAAVLLRHAHYCLPLLLLSAALTGYEQTGARHYRMIDSSQLTLLDCRWVRLKSKSGAESGPPLKLCDVAVQDGQHSYRYYGLPAPDGEITSLEVRQALFKHYRLR